MPETKLDINSVVLRAMDFKERMEGLLGEYVGSIGYEKVSTKHIRQRVREAMAGDAQAMEEVGYLADLNRHDPNEVEPCPVCFEIREVLKEKEHAKSE